MEIIWFEKAKDDLIDYQRNSRMLKEKVEKYIDEILEQIENLKLFPQSGKVIFIRKNYEIRQLIFKIHRILYTIHNSEIRVLSVICTSQNFNSKILNEILKIYLNQ